jgi:hypothetical protein
MNLFPDGGAPPRDPVANLIFRVLLLDRMERDKRFAAAVAEICRQDAVFFMTAFGWLYEPRPRRNKRTHQLLPKTIPFTIWDHQEPVVRALEEYLGENDVAIDKARGEGATWMVIWMAIRTIAMFKMAKVGMVSHKLDQVYKPNDIGTLLGKFEWGFLRLPRAFVDPKLFERSGNKAVLHYGGTDSTATGYTSTEDVASGDRLDWILMDELGKFPAGKDEEAVTSTQAVTDCRIIVSTPKRASGAYYRIIHEPSNVIKLVLDWTENPSRNRGLYRFQSGIPVAVDPVKNPLPDSYNPPSREILDLFERLRSRGYQLDASVRSPWFDRECDRANATPEKIARELCRDFGGAETVVFGRGFFLKLQETVRPPVARGNLAVSSRGLVIELQDQGPLSLWMPLDVYSEPPRSSYVIAADIARGESLLGSNSVLTAVDLRTRTQVLEFVTKIMEPKPLADLAVAMAIWLGDAYLAWEQNGPGLSFGSRVLELNYGNVYDPRPLDDKRRKRSTRAGWVSNERTKPELFAELSDVVQTGDLIVCSAECRDEASQYVIDERGKIIHVSAANNVPNHGDRVIALGVAAQAMKDRPFIAPSADPSERDSGPAPLNSVAYRDQLHEQADRDRDYDWDDRTLSDLMGRTFEFTLN